MVITHRGSYLFSADAKGNLQQWSISKSKLHKNWGQIHAGPVTPNPLFFPKNFLGKLSLDQFVWRVHVDRCCQRGPKNSELEKRNCQRFYNKLSWVGDHCHGWVQRWQVLVHLWWRRQCQAIFYCEVWGSLWFWEITRFWDTKCEYKSVWTLAVY